MTTLDRGVTTPPRTPPHDLDAEASVLGAALSGRDAIQRIRDVGLEPADFYKPAHAQIWAAVVALDSTGDPVDPVTVAAALKAKGAEPAVDRKALLELRAFVPASGNRSNLRDLVPTASDLGGGGVMSMGASTSGTGGGDGGDVNITVHVAGSVLTERDLVDAVQEGLYRNFRQGRGGIPSPGSN